MGDAAVNYHVNPETGRPNVCTAGDHCPFGSADFHYPDKHDAEVAWRARQLERGIIAYRNVMRATEKDEEQAALTRLTSNAKGEAKKISTGIVRGLISKNLSKYLVNFLSAFVAYTVASGRWVSTDLKRLMPVAASIVLAALVAWFALKLWKGSRKAAAAARQRRVRKRVSRARG